MPEVPRFCQYASQICSGRSSLFFHAARFAVPFVGKGA